MHWLVLFSYVDLICGSIRVFGMPSVNSRNILWYPVSRPRYGIGTLRIQVRIDTLWAGIFGGHRTVHKYRSVWHRFIKCFSYIFLNDQWQDCCDWCIVSYAGRTGHPICYREVITRHLLCCREVITRHPIYYMDAITRHQICYRYSVTRHPVYYGEIIARHLVCYTEVITRHPVYYRDAITRHPICYRYSVTRHPVYYGDVIMRHPIYYRDAISSTFCVSLESLSSQSLLFSALSTSGRSLA